MKTDLAKTESAKNKKRKQTGRNYGYQFYRDNFRRMTVLALILIALNSLLVLAMVFVYTNYPERDLYATTRNGLLVKLRQFDNVDQVAAYKNAKAAKLKTVNQSN